jgi:hypothetical protein
MPGTFISKSYVSKVNYDQNGQPHKETYQTQSIRQTDKDGKKIQEKQQAYQNSKTGMQKAAHERLLNEKGHKIIKARNRNTGEDYEHAYFKGMNDNELENFNNDYSDYRQKVKFQDNYKLLENFGSRRVLPEANRNPLRLDSTNNNFDINENPRSSYQQPKALPSSTNKSKR